MNETEIGGWGRALVGPPGLQPCEVGPEEPKLAVEGGDGISSLAPQIERQPQENRSHHSAVEPTEPSKLGGRAGRALEDAVNQASKRRLPAVSPKSGDRSDTTLDDEKQGQEKDGRGECQHAVSEWLQGEHRYHAGLPPTTVRLV